MKRHSEITKASRRASGDNPEQEPSRPITSVPSIRSAVRFACGALAALGLVAACLFAQEAASGAGLSQDTGSRQDAAASPLKGGASARRTDANAQAVARGRYVALAADCAACHTDPQGGRLFAGGYALQTPFGKLVASNITMDKATGIGAWTEQEFTRAVREGKGRHGENLYPAMPYNAYVKISDQDMRDLWAYMRTIEPVEHKVVSNQLPFPFNIRLLMSGWNLLFFDQTPFTPIDGQSAEVNRGAYLVQGLGHCAVCHTPKNFLGGDKAGAFLQGGDLGGWHAPEITSNAYTGIGSWSSPQIVQYLKTGSNPLTVAAGPMAEVVTDSTQHMTDSDLTAIASYLKTLPGSSHTRPAPLREDDAQMRLGARVYAANCAACHARGGEGIAGIASRFPGNPGIHAPSTASLLTTVLLGGRGAVTGNNPTSGAMPAFAWKLSDEQIAAVLTYLRNHWGNAAPAVSAQQVADARKRTGSRSQLQVSPPASVK